MKNVVSEIKAKFANNCLKENQHARRFKLTNHTIGAHRDKVMQKYKREVEEQRSQNGLVQHMPSQSSGKRNNRMKEQHLNGQWLRFSQDPESSF